MDVIQAENKHVEGIAEVCIDANRETYKEIYPNDYIERIIDEFYRTERIAEEVGQINRDWGGYWVAVENDRVIGACGGGMVAEEEAEVYVLYLDPNRRSEGIGSKLLAALTAQQRNDFGAKKQWVSVQKGNTKGIPFYEARGFIFDRKQKGYGSKEAERYVSLRYWREI